MVVTGNETVLFHYRVLLADGRVVESSGANPERVCLGEGAVPAKLEDSFTGRHPGEAYHMLSSPLKPLRRCTLFVSSKPIIW